jgi:hypothetical protein
MAQVLTLSSFPSRSLPRRRSGALGEVLAGAALLVVWVMLWSWLVAGVAAPAHTAAERLVADANRASLVVTLAR